MPGSRPAFGAHLDVLRGLPFVHGVRAGPSWLELRTRTGRHRLRLVIVRGPWSPGFADALASARREPPVVLFADRLDAKAKALLRARGVSYVDAAGNCYVTVGEDHFAWVEGKRPALPPPRERGIRRAGYQAMFALLALPELAGASARALARAAAVSVPAATDMRRRLEQERILGRTVSGGRLLKPAALLERWLVGYADLVRPRLFLGRYRATESDLGKLEARIEEALGEGLRWGFGGGAAAYRLTRHYRGEETVVHFDAKPEGVESRLGLREAVQGPVVLLRAPGPVAFTGAAAPRTVHPLLVYSELVHAGSERALDTAAEIRARYLPGLS